MAYARVLVCLGLVVLLACHEADSVIVVSLTAEAGVPSITQLRTTLSNRGTADVKVYPQATTSTPISFVPPTTLAIVVPRSRSGNVDIVVDGLDSTMTVVASGSARAVINPGGRVDVSVSLVAGMSLCGDGHVDSGEDCDDGNRISGDGCDYECRKEQVTDGGLYDRPGSGGGADAGGSGGAISNGGSGPGGEGGAGRDGPIGSGGSAGRSGIAGGSGGRATGGSAMAGAGGTGGSGGLGGRIGTGGTIAAGGAGSGGRTGTGTGGSISTGGTHATGGIVGSGGSLGTGGASGGAGGGPPGTTLCGQTYVNLMTNAAHCGACGYACVNGRTCAGSRCTPAWQPIATANGPGPRLRHAAAFLRGKFYVMGGVSTCSGASNGVWAYDPGANTWGAVMPMSFPRVSHSAVASSTKIFVFGGITDCSAGNTTGPLLEAFDPDSGWSNIDVPSTPSPRYNFSMTWTGSDLFLYGGGDNTQPFLSSGGRLSPGATIPSWTDASCSIGQCERGNGALFAWNGVVYRWGGNGGNAPAGLQYDLTLGTWSPWALPVGTPDLVGPLNADGGRYVYVLVPASAGCPSTIEVRALDKQTMTWRSPDQSTGPGNLGADTTSSAGAAAWSGSEVIVWGGIGACGTTASYDGGGRYQPPAP